MIICRVIHDTMMLLLDVWNDALDLCSPHINSRTSLAMQLRRCSIQNILEEQAFENLQSHEL
jgi:hypothetical protein